MSSLMEYFKSRNQESAIHKITVHMDKVLECIVEFDKAMAFLIEEKNYDLALKVFLRVNELEHQADIIRRDVLNMLSEAEMKTKVRENLSHLTKRIDDVANAANACARILVYMNFEDFRKIDQEVHEKMVQMSHISLDCVKQLRLMLDSMLNGSSKQINEKSNQVNLLEHKADELHFAINRILVAGGDKYGINPFSAHEMMKMLTKLENISDAAETVADYLVILELMTKG